MEKQGKTETIIPVVLLCAVDRLGKVEKRSSNNYTENALCDSEILLILYFLVFFSSATDG